MEPGVRLRRWPVIAAPFALVALLLALLSSPGQSARASDGPSGISPVGGVAVDSIPSLSWSAVPDAHHYEVQLSVDDTFASASLRYNAEVFNTHATLTRDLAPNVPYFWRARAIDIDGTAGTYGGTQIFTRSSPTAPLPITPSDNATIPYPTTAPVLRWQASSGVKSYQIQWSTNINFSSGAGETVTTKTSVTNSIAVDALLSPGRDYYWRVRALYPTARTASTSEDKYTDYSAPRRFRLEWVNPGSVPQLLSPADTSDPNAALMAPEFRWTPVSGASQYRIQVSASPTMTPLTLEQVVTRNAYTPTASLTSGAYYWQVATVDAGGNQGPWSDQREFYRDWLDSDGQSARPTISIDDSDAGTAGIQVYRDEVLVQWDPIPGASHYEVQFARNDNESFQNASKLTTCKTPNTAITPVYEGSYAGTTKLSDCNVLKGSGGIGSTNVNLWTEPFAYVRVRAVDEKTSSGQLTSLWSDQARPGGSAPGPVRMDLVAPPSTGTLGTEPATLEGPTNGLQRSSNPVLTWQRVENTGVDTKYLVAMSKSQNFDASVLNPLAVGMNYVVTGGTRLVLSEELLDSQAGESYYWYVLPCSAWTAPGSNSGCVADNAAINNNSDPNTVRQFRKVTPRIRDPLTETLPGAGATGFRFTWRDQVDSEQVADAADSDPTHEYVPAGVKHYQVEVSTDPGFVNVAKRVLQTTTDSPHLVPQIAWNPTETYYWRVRAIDGANQSLTWSATQTLANPVGAPAPSSFTTVGNSPMPTMTWSTVPGATSYEVELYSGTDPDFPSANLVSGYPKPTAYPAFTPPTQLPAGTYSWRARALDDFGMDGNWPTTGPSYPVQLTSVALVQPASASTSPLPALFFDWEPVGGAVDYVLQVSGASDFASVYDSVTTSGTEAVPTKDGGYAAGTYYWRVQARANNVVLSTSATRPLTVTTVQAKPTGLKATASKTEAGVIALSWAPPANLGGQATTGYRLWLRPQGGTWAEQSPSDSGSVTRAISGLTVGTTYEFQIAAVNAVGTSQRSSTASLKAIAPNAPTPSPTPTPTTPVNPPRVVAPGPPGKPSGKAKGSGTKRKLKVVWTAPVSGGAPTSYAVERSADKKKWKSVTTTGTSVSWRSKKGTRIYVRVHPKNTAGWGPYSTVVRLKG